MTPTRPADWRARELGAALRRFRNAGLTRIEAGERLGISYWYTKELCTRFHVSGWPQGVRSHRPRSAKQETNNGAV